MENIIYETITGAIQVDDPVYVKSLKKVLTVDSIENCQVKFIESKDIVPLEYCERIKKI